jgi:hypothetical protein
MIYLFGMSAAGSWLVYMLCACAPAAPAVSPGVTPQPEFSFTLKQSDDSLTTFVEGGTQIFEVTSPGGIGSAEVSWTNGGLPPDSLVRLYLQGLESFTLVYQDRTLQLSVSGPDAEVVERIATVGDQPVETPEPGSHFWMDVRRTGSADAYIFEITLPSDLYTQETDQFQISWIDFYRQ